MRVTIVGCSDAFGSGGRFQTATLVEVADGTCLVDCGATTMTALHARAFDADRISTIVLTHLHGDHFGGLPFFLLDAQWARRRTADLVIVGPPGTRRRLHDTLEALYPGSAARSPWSFLWKVVELAPDNPDLTWFGPFGVRSVEVIHPSGAPATAVRVETGEGIFAHSGDTQWTDVLPGLAAGADIFFAECFSFDQRMPIHMDYRMLEEKRALFDARRIVLTHMGPDMLARLKDVDRVLFDVASDGRVFDIGPRS